MGEPSNEKQQKQAKAGSADRDERLRKALKENLNKRKAQSRARKAEQEK